MFCRIYTPIFTDFVKFVNFRTKYEMRKNDEEIKALIEYINDPGAKVDIEKHKIEV